jgi:hypothetical protein
VFTLKQNTPTQKGLNFTKNARGVKVKVLIFVKFL